MSKEQEASEHTINSVNTGLCLLKLKGAVDDQGPKSVLSISSFKNRPPLLDVSRGANEDYFWEHERSPPRLHSFFEQDNSTEEDDSSEEELSDDSHISSEEPLPPPSDAQSAVHIRGSSRGERLWRHRSFDGTVAKRRRLDPFMTGDITNVMEALLPYFRMSPNCKSVSYMAAHAMHQQLDAPSCSTTVSF